MSKVLFVIDMQNDFISGSLGTKEAEAIVDRVSEKIKSYFLNKDGYVIFTQDTHDANYLKHQEGKYLPVPHCIALTNGWELHENIKREIENDRRDHIARTYFIKKPTFGVPYWPETLRQSGIAITQNDEIEIVGLCTDICVVSNALILKAWYPENHITVDASCCAGVTPEKHNAALETMRSCQIDVINQENKRRKNKRAETE